MDSEAPTSVRRCRAHILRSEFDIHDARELSPKKEDYDYDQVIKNLSYCGGSGRLNHADTFLTVYESFTFGSKELKPCPTCLERIPPLILLEYTTL